MVISKIYGHLNYIKLCHHLKNYFLIENLSKYPEFQSKLDLIETKNYILVRCFTTILYLI